MERSLLLFQNSLKSEKSFGTYLRNLNLFRRFIGSEDFDSITRTNTVAENIVVLEGYHGLEFDATRTGIGSAQVVVTALCISLEE